MVFVFPLRAALKLQEVSEPVALILQQAAELGNAGKLEEALVILSSARERYPEAAPRLSSAMGVSNLILENDSEAVRLFRQGYEGNPDSALKGMATIAARRNDLNLSITIAPALFNVRAYGWEHVCSLLILGIQNDIKSPIYYSEVLAGLSPDYYMSVEPVKELIHDYSSFFGYVPDITAILSNYPRHDKVEDKAQPVRLKELRPSDRLKVRSAVGKDPRIMEISGNGLEITGAWFLGQQKLIVRLSYPAGDKSDAELSFEVNLKQMDVWLLNRPTSEPIILSRFSVDERTTIFEDQWLKIDLAQLKRAADGDLRLGFVFLLRDGDQYLRNDVVYNLKAPDQASHDILLSIYSEDRENLSVDRQIGFLEDFIEKNPTNSKVYLYLAEAIHLRDGVEAVEETLQKTFRDYPLESLKILADIALKERDSKLALVAIPGLMHYRSEDVNCVALLIRIGLMSGIDSPIYYSSLIQGIQPSSYLSNAAVRSLIQQHKAYFSYVKDLDEILKAYPQKNDASTLGSGTLSGSKVLTTNA